MNKVIVITGTPGVGKSTVAKAFAKKSKWHRLEVADHYTRISTGYNRQKQCYNVDMRKFEKLVREELRRHPQGIIVDSHIAHLLPRQLVRLCIVLTCSDLKRLEQRLKRRKYSGKKIRENLDAEIFQVCLQEAREKKHLRVEADTSTMSMKEILRKLGKYL